MTMGEAMLGSMIGIPLAIIVARELWTSYRTSSVPFSMSLSLRVPRSKWPMFFWLMLSVGGSTLVCTVATVGWSIFKLVEPRQYENTGKMWVQQAMVVVKATGQDKSMLLAELGRFANEKGAEIRNFPLPAQSNVAFSIHLGSETHFGVDNGSDPGNLFYINAFSHDRPSNWAPDWTVLISRLSVLFGKERIRIHKSPPG